MAGPHRIDVVPLHQHDVGPHGGLVQAAARFGMPLVPSGLALWAINFVDRLFLNTISGAAETGLYSIGVRISSVIVFLFTAFRTAWPAFAYSIEDDREARRTYGFVLTYLLLLCCWLPPAGCRRGGRGRSRRARRSP